MSSRPDSTPGSGVAERVTLSAIAGKRARREPIAMITAYDYPSAQIVDAAGIDIVLVGDSAAMTVLGHDDTVSITVEEMVMLAAAVRRGLRRPLLVADLPFGSYEVSDEQAITTALKFVKAAGADAVKIERGGSSVARARALVDAGIPVMGHVGLTPQTANSVDGYRARGRTAEQAMTILDSALALQRAGCFALVLEAIPTVVTDAMMPLMDIPVIGIGAGPHTDGQVLVYHDVLGLYAGHPARFVKRYAELRQPMIDAVGTYVRDVRTRAYPAAEHGYGMAEREQERLREALAEAGHRGPAKVSD